MIAAACFVYGVLLLILLGNVLYLTGERRRAATHQTLPSVAILVPARNEENNIGRLLRSLLSQDYPLFHVHVYDDDSSDRTADVVQSFIKDDRINLHRGSGPPAGWAGKVHALYSLTRHADADIFLFLDADVELLERSALRRIVGAYQFAPHDSVVTALPSFRGGGMLLVSLIPNVILTMIPWFLLRRLKARQLGALNGQCWLIDADMYRRIEPHLQVRNEILEDVEIGRLLVSQGIQPHLVDLTRHVSVRMYGSLGDALSGLSKNAYLIAGGHPAGVVAASVFILWLYVAVPVAEPLFLIPMYLQKAITDRLGRVKPPVSIGAPISYLLAVGALLLSARAHWTGQVFWKNRRMTASSDS
ncbi:MAG: glycosyltransferase [Bacteroidota bacterium]